jgi:protocatechuate 3,4-dioxygenase beta subunit
MSAVTLRRLAVSAAIVAVACVVLSAQGGGGGGRAGGPGVGGGGQRGGGPGRAGFPRDDNNTIATGTGAISGTVVRDGTGAPVKRARVTLNGAEVRGGRSVLTDDQGRFVFQALPAGRFTMTASKPGFVDGTYGAKRPGRPGTPIQLADGQVLERATIVMPRGSVITGLVVDEAGEPAAGTTIRALRFVLRTGERTLQPAGQAVADDRGIYRIYQLQPGDYIVNAVPRNLTTNDLREALASQVQTVVQQAQGANGGAAISVNIGNLATLADQGVGADILERALQLQQQLAQSDLQPSEAYAPVYYPGTTSLPSATTLTLDVGEERAGVDFQLQLVPTWRVSGIVVMPSGALPQGTQVALVPSERASLPNANVFGTNQTRVAADGRFTFTNVTPGQYSLQARAIVRDPAPNAAAPNAAGARGGGQVFFGRGGIGGPGSISQVLWAAADVSVGGQHLSNLVLNLQPGMGVKGRVDFEAGSQQPPDPTRVMVTLSSRGTQTFEMGVTPPGEVDASGRFSIPGVAPGRYTINATVLPYSPSQDPAGRGGRGGRGFAAPGNASGGWRLKSAIVDGRDVLDFPLEVGPNQDVSNAILTFTEKTQELSGTIQDTSGRPTSDFTIILFPSDNRYWTPQSRRIASARPGTDGRFTFRGIPAGEYRLTAVTDVEPGEWYDPAFLGQVQQASIPISLAEGATKVQDIRLAGGR